MIKWFAKTAKRKLGIEKMTKHRVTCSWCRKVLKRCRCHPKTGADHSNGWDVFWENMEGCREIFKETEAEKKTGKHEWDGEKWVLKDGLSQ